MGKINKLDALHNHVKGWGTQHDVEFYKYSMQFNNLLYITVRMQNVGMVKGNRKIKSNIILKELFPFFSLFWYIILKIFTYNLKQRGSQIEILPLKSYLKQL